MNKTELVKALADKTGKPQKEAKAFLEAFESTMKETLAWQPLRFSQKRASKIRNYLNMKVL